MNIYNSNLKSKNRKEQFREVIMQNFKQNEKNYKRKKQRNKEKTEKNK